MFCHNKPIFRARSEGFGRLAHSVYNDNLNDDSSYNGCACVCPLVRDVPFRK